ncbi:MAG: hypothetical protein JWP14_786 [Frankiales bacterium]|jgi:hypothetical protein|nr:hypothetical protein [Frankiales bacterium]
MSGRGWPVWVPMEGVSDSRLVFLVCQQQLSRLSRPWWARLFRVLEAGAGSSTIADRGMAKVPGGGLLFKRTVTSDITGDRMASLVLACDQLADRLTEPERLLLRSQGSLPEGFVADVALRAKQIRSEWRTVR